MTLERDAEDFRRGGRTAFLWVGNRKRSGKKFVLMFRLTLDFLKAAPPARRSIEIDLAYNRWVSFDLTWGGKQYKE